MEMYSGSVYRGRVQLATLTPTCTPPPFSPLRSCTFNSTECCEACIPASATAPFHQLASWPLNLIPCSFFFPPSGSLLYLCLCLCPSHLCSGEPDECSRRSVVRARARPDVTVWLSRTLAQGIWACCNVTVAAQLQDNIMRHVHLIMTDFYAYFCF